MLIWWWRGIVEKVCTGAHVEWTGVSPTFRWRRLINFVFDAFVLLEIMALRSIPTLSKSVNLKKRQQMVNPLQDWLLWQWLVNVLSLCTLIAGKCARGVKWLLSQPFKKWYPIKCCSISCQISRGLSSTSPLWLVSQSGDFIYVRHVLHS